MRTNTQREVIANASIRDLVASTKNLLINHPPYLVHDFARETFPLVPKGKRAAFLSTLVADCATDTTWGLRDYLVLYELFREIVRRDGQRPEYEYPCAHCVLLLLSHLGAKRDEAIGFSKVVHAFMSEDTSNDDSQQSVKEHAPQRSRSRQQKNGSKS